MQSRSRVAFLDAVRGVALVLMVVNHTARWWLGDAMEPGRSHLVYATVILPGAMFLFLVGFSLPLSRAGRPVAKPWSDAVWKWVRRGAGIIATGLLLNVVVFPEDPPWSGRVLHTIGLSVMLLGPAVPLVRGPVGRVSFVAVAVGLYVTFVLLSPVFVPWLASHPWVAQVLFREFPPWAWLGVPMLGLVVASVWLDCRRRGAREERTFFTASAAVGIGALLGAVLLEWWLDPRPRSGFARDLIVNDGWTPVGGTVLLIVGGTAVLLSLAWWLIEVRRFAFGWLQLLGRTALMLYVFHHVIVLTLVSRALDWRADTWPVYGAANVLLVIVLVAAARAWVAMTALAARRFATRMTVTTAPAAARTIDTRSGAEQRASRPARRRA